MKRVEANEDWSLFCPSEAPGLHEVYGDEFEELYAKYEKEGRAQKKIPAQKLWAGILEAQIETGGPFMVYKDHANRECQHWLLPILSNERFKANPTKRIWGLSSHPISARKSLSTRRLTRRLSATLHLWLSPPSSRTENMISRSFTKSPRQSLST